MINVKTRKQGNSITVTIPSEYNIPAGAKLKPELKNDGIFYKFVDDNKNFLNFDEDILKDIVDEGYQGDKLVKEFLQRKSRLQGAFDSIAKDTLENNKPQTKEELAKEIGL